MNIKAKGNAGENEACVWLRDNLNLLTTPKRNLAQGFVGCDIQVGPLVIEVKRQEKLNYNGWWIQVSKVATTMLKHGVGGIPIVMFRQNNKRWEFLISATVIGDEYGWVHINQDRFKGWAKMYVPVALSRNQDLG